MPRTQKRGRGRPRKETTVPKRQTKAPQGNVSRSLSSIRWTESYTSLLMGVVVVILGVLFVASVFKQTHHTRQTSSIATSVAPTTIAQKPTSNNFPAKSLTEQKQNTYTVKSGDDLWHIAEMFYKSGYNWIDIARANNLADPSTIHAGNVLVIPSVTPEVATVSPIPVIPQTAQKIEQSNAISGNTYTVKSGDTLWSIAVRAYNNGYKWVDIAKVNNLSTPGLIYSGNVLKIPR